MQTIQKQPLGHWLLIAVAIGLGAYAAWRFVQAYAGHGPEGGGDQSTFGRIAAAGSGCAYAALCVLAVSILLGSSSSTSSNPHSQTAGVFAWPAGQWLVGAAGGPDRDRPVPGLQGPHPEVPRGRQDRGHGHNDDALDHVIGVLGHLARAVAFGLIGIFLLKAAWTYNPTKAVGLDGALAKLARQSYGSFLLGLVAAGLIAFGLFSIAEARYRRI